MEGSEPIEKFKDAIDSMDMSKFAEEITNAPKEVVEKLDKNLQSLMSLHKQELKLLQEMKDAILYRVGRIILLRDEIKAKHNL